MNVSTKIYLTHNLDHKFKTQADSKQREMVSSIILSQDFLCKTEDKQSPPRNASALPNFSFPHQIITKFKFT